MTDARSQRNLMPLTETRNQSSRQSEESSSQFLIGEAVAVDETGKLICETRGSGGEGRGYIRAVIPDAARYSSAAIVRNAINLREYAILVKSSYVPPTSGPEADLFRQGELYGYYVLDSSKESPAAEDGIQRRWLTDGWSKIELGTSVYVISVNGDIGTISQPQGSGGLRYFDRGIPLDKDTAARSDRRLDGVIRSITGLSDVRRVNLDYVIEDGDTSDIISTGSITSVDTEGTALHSLTISRNGVLLISSDRREGQAGTSRLTVQPERVFIQVIGGDGSTSAAVLLPDSVELRIGTSRITLMPDSIELETANEDGDGVTATFNADGIALTGDDFTFNGDAVRTG